MANQRVEKLLKAREELCNSFVCNKEKLEALAKLRLGKQAQFHNYSTGNLVHYYLNHYEKLDNKEITRSQAEAEAETIAFMILTAMGFDNDLKSADYINAWHNNPVEVINGEELIQTAEFIMKELKIE